MSAAENALTDATHTESAELHSLFVIKELAVTLLSVIEEAAGGDGAAGISLHEGISLHDEVARYEVKLIRRALLLTGLHQARAARLLNVKPTTLHAKLKRHNIHLFDADAAPADKPE